LATDSTGRDQNQAGTGGLTKTKRRTSNAQGRISAVREWPLEPCSRHGRRYRSKILRGKARIAEVESHFQGLKLAVTRRHACGDIIVVEWNSDYGDGRIYRNVSIGELQDGKVARVTDYWGEQFARPEWRRGLSDSEDVRPHADELTNE
jgi:hypothetical protein